MRRRLITRHGGRDVVTKPAVAPLVPGQLRSGLQLTNSDQEGEGKKEKPMQEGTPWCHHSLGWLNDRGEATPQRRPEGMRRDTGVNRGKLLIEPPSFLGPSKL